MKRTIFPIILIIAALAIVYAVLPRQASNDLTAGWNTFSDNRVTFKYPEKLGTKYIDTVDWPPAVQLVGDYSCSPGGSEAGRAGVTETIVVNGRSYCLTRVVQGAAGSIYTSYAYAFPKSSLTAILTFSLRSPQCANYPDPEKTACETEEQNFNVDEIADAMAQSLKLSDYLFQK